jgi:hypothetical protein
MCPRLRRAGACSPPHHRQRTDIAIVSVAVITLFASGVCLAQDEPGAEPGGAPTALVKKPPPPPAKAPPVKELVAKSQADVETCLAARPSGPSLAAIRRAVIRQAGVSRHDVSVAMRGERFKGLLPRLHVLGLYTGEDSSSESKMMDVMYKRLGYKEQTTATALSDRYYVGGLMSFDLSTLALGGKRLKALPAVKYRNGLIQKVNDLYFKRKALALKLCSQNLGALDTRLTRLRIERLTALLDGLAGGVISRAAKPVAAVVK